MGRGRPRNSLNVTDVERERIRSLYLQGIRVADIARRVKRGESVVQKAVRGMRRPRPAPRPRVTRRNELIVRRIVKEKLSMSAVARRFHLTPTRVCQIVREALGLIPSKAEAVKRREQAWLAAVRKRDPQRRRAHVAPVLNREQRTTRNREIRRLVVDEGVSLAVVARRYGISPARVRQLARRPPRRTKNRSG